MFTRISLIAASLAGSTFATAPAAAQALQDHFWIETSAYWPRVDTSVRLSSTRSGAQGTSIDLESDLALDKHETLPAVFAGVRLGSNFSIGGEYYSLSRKGSNVISRDIVFDDITYPASARVSTKFSTDVYRLTLGYAFIRKENFELGAALGLHATRFKVRLDGETSIGDQSANVEGRRHDFLAPLPTLGLFTAFEVAPRLTLNGRIDYLSLKIDDYDGRLINTQASISYRALKNVGIGATYRYVDYRVDVEKQRWTGRVSYKFKGPAVFLQFGF
ncbi:outer membrane beta-barrel protein [Edaphosphingomonas haloaromaticamans]|uniref:Outer membrane protein beta-barrel domain-containing protein n=1 Tax=Edaphosphingomonas haloaromaticamans TaxID=653954 RepID=A0A1S1HGJ2_9SPHN|nr:outer membrane beta-barrel protein [Sphingomonas haloaromaticamans]OHT20601.1 hypothetical protein BHE75_02600 [Sphingomonas haloaromaticamans]